MGLVPTADRWVEDALAIRVFRDEWDGIDVSEPAVLCEAIDIRKEPQHRRMVVGSPSLVLYLTGCGPIL